MKMVFKVLQQNSRDGFQETTTVIVDVGEFAASGDFNAAKARCEKLCRDQIMWVKEVRYSGLTDQVEIFEHADYEKFKKLELPLGEGTVARITE